MAGDWIKITKALPDKPEVWAIAEKLNLDPDAVVGKLLRVWSWFDDQSENGNALSVTRMLLDRQVGVVGFCDALAGVGWLDIEQDYIAIPNFDRHNSETAKSRALAALRAAKLRKKKQIAALELQDSNGDSVTGLLPEKRREEKSIKEKPTAKKATKNLPFDSEKFSESWGEWETYRAEIKKKLTPSTIKKQLNALSKLTETDAICTINLSIQNGWQGLFPERSSGHSGAARGNRNAASNDRNAGTANAGRAADYADLG